MYRVVESLGRNTCLGIRFWDAVTGGFVRDTLRVSAFPMSGPRKLLDATQNRSGVYAFNHLPGLREIEQRADDDFYLVSPSDQRSFVVEVRDTSGDFLDVGFIVDLPLPYPGVYLSDPLSSPPEGVPKGVNLFSSIKRTPPPMVAAIRAELVDADTDAPAAHAVMSVRTEDGYRWYGVSNNEGKVAVLMPYPMLVDGLGGSPHEGGPGMLSVQTWTLAVDIRYSPELVDRLPLSSLVDYATVLNQPPAEVWLERAAVDVTPLATLDVPLRYGEDVVLKTDGLSTLMVTPVASPPS